MKDTTKTLTVKIVKGGTRALPPVCPWMVDY